MQLSSSSFLTVVPSDQQRERKIRTDLPDLSFELLPFHPRGKVTPMAHPRSPYESRRGSTKEGAEAWRLALADRRAIGDSVPLEWRKEIENKIFILRLN